MGFHSYRKNLASFADLGVQIQITEMDVARPIEGSGPPEYQ